MKKLSTLILILCASASVQAQQEFQLSHYVVNPFMTNPANATMDDYWETKVGYRNQWNGIEGAPVTTYVSSQKPIGKPHWGRTHPGDFHNWHGVGGYFMKDEIGAYSNTKFNLAYGYNIGLSQGNDYGYEHKDGLRVALGMFLGGTQYNVDRYILSRNKVSDWSTSNNPLTTNDPTYNGLPEQSRFAMDMSFGAMFYYGERYFLGVSSSQMLQNDIDLTDGTQLDRHYYITGKTKIDIGEHWFVIPAGMFKVVKGAPISWDFSARLDWEDKAFIGGGYRYQDAFTLMAGLRYHWGEQIKHFRVDKHRYNALIYYSYDITTSKLASRDLLQRSKGSHEITIGFLLPPMFHERNAEDTWKGWKKAHHHR